MRVISGKLGGRTFRSPSGNRTHPMSDKVRGAIFNMLGDVEGLTALDAFAGSGALGFEALSRGAKHVVAVDSDKSAHRAIQENASALGLGAEIKTIRANVSGWSDNNPDVQFDLVLCDPPYDRLQLSLVAKLTRHVKDGGLLVLSWPGAAEIPELDGAQEVARNDYGDAQVVVYRK